MLLVSLALAAPAMPAPVPAPRLLVMHADPALPGGWWVSTAGSGRPLDTVALAQVLRNTEVPRALEAHRRRVVAGQLTFGVLAGATFLGGAMLAGSVTQPVVPGAEPAPGGYDTVESFRTAHDVWTSDQTRADTRDEVLTDAVVLLAGSALCLVAVPLIGSDRALRLRHPGMMWSNEDAVDQIEAYNARLRASVELTPVGARFTVELP